MKVAIYVEGITEAAFVYRLIGEQYQWDWSAFRMECLHLDPAKAASDLHDYGDENSKDYFLIYDSGSDSAVSSDIRDRFENHRDNGFDKVVGLRDVYSERFIDLYGRQMNRNHIDSFIYDMQDTLAQYDSTGFIRLRFAIMETESWLLAMSDVFSRIDHRIDAQWLIDRVQIDVNDNPESAYFHPFSHLVDIYTSVSRTYSKHWDEIKEIIFKLSQNDFDMLYNSGKCPSFRDFVDAIFI